MVADSSVRVSTRSWPSFAETFAMCCETWACCRQPRLVLEAQWPPLGESPGGEHAVTADMERDYEESIGTRGLDLLKPYKRASNSWRMDIKA